MKVSWTDARRDADGAALARSRTRQRDAKPQERLDRVLTGVFVLGFAALAASGWLWARSIDARGDFDPEVLRPLPDARLLTNLRDSDAPFIGAAALNDGAGPILMAREDGQVTLFDPETELISTEQLPGADAGLETPPQSLGSACGLVEPGDTAVGCTLPESAFVRTQAGGIAARLEGRWRVLLSDEPWIGLENSPVEQDQVQAWAASADGAQVMVFAGAQGLGLFDRGAGRWRAVPGGAALRDAANEGPVTLLAHDDAFWIGTPRGLARLSQRAGSGAGLDWSEDRASAVRDLDVTANNRLIALLEGPCAQGGSDCFSIARVRGLDTLERLVGETERPDGLNAAGVYRAVLQGDKIVTVGGTGIHAYDPSARGWRTLFPGRIDAFLVARDSTITAVQSDTMVMIKGAVAGTLTPVTGAPYVRLARTSQGLIGLAADGTLRRLPGGAILAGDGDPVPEGAAFRTGASLGHLTLLAGSDGVLLHRMDRREMRWLSARSLRNQVPSLLDPGTEVHASMGRFWTVSRRSGRIGVLSIDGNFPAQSLTEVTSAQLAAPLRSISAAPNALTLVDSNGVPFRVRPPVQGTGSTIGQIGLVPQIGPALPRAQSFTFAAAYRDGLLFGNTSELWDYKSSPRSWQGPIRPPQDQLFAEISVGNTLFARTTGGEVHELRDGRWNAVLDGGAPAAVPLSAVTDARRVGSRLYLAGAGRVQVYDLASNGFGQVWSGGLGAVQLVEIDQAGLPVWLSGGRLFKGDQRMLDTEVTGAWEAPGGVLAMARLVGGNASVFFADGATDLRCTHFGASAPEGAMIDAIGLGDGRVLAVTSGGVALHDPANRRWIGLDGLSVSSDLRLHIARDHLIAVTADRFRAVPLTDIPRPDTCAQPRASLAWTLDETAESVSFDAASGRVAVLDASGQVRLWSGQGLQSLLPANNTGPNEADVRDAAALPGALALATQEAVWTYDLSTRRWNRAPLVYPTGSSRAVREIDIAPEGQGALVTVWTADGGSYGGTLNSATARNVALRALTPVALPEIPLPADQITDMAAYDNVWSVGSTREIAFGRRADDALTGRLSLPPQEGIAPTPLHWGPLTGFRANQNAVSGPIYLLPQDRSPTALNGALSQLAYRYDRGDDRAAALAPDGQVFWRVTAAGVILSCPVEAGENTQTNCVQAVEPPMRVTASQIDLAFDLGDHRMLILDGVLHAADANLRSVEPIPGPRLRDTGAVFQWSGSTYLLEQPGGTLWHLDGAETRVAARRIAETVHALNATRATLDILSDTQLLYVPRNDPSAPAQRYGRVLGYDWIGNRGAHVLDADNRLTWNNGRSQFTLSEPERISGALSTGSLDLGQRRVRTGVATVRDGRVFDVVASRLCSAGPHLDIPCIGSILPRPVDVRGLGRLMWISQTRSTLAAQFREGAVQIDLRSGAITRDATPAELPLPERRTFQTQGTRNLIAPSPGGFDELNPPRLLSSTDSLELSDQSWRRRVAAAPMPWEALENEVFAWDRQSARLVFAGQTGPIALRPEEAIIGGRFLPALPGRAAVLPGDKGFAWLTRQGLWHYSAPGRPAALVSRAPVPVPQALDRGQFLLPGQQQLDRTTGALGGGPTGQRLAFGALQIDEDMRSQAVTFALAPRNGATASAYGVTGFVHDQRQSIGWRGAAAVLVTPLGLVPVQGLDAVDPLPPGGARPDRVVMVGQDMFARAGVRWFRSPSAGQWQAAQDPFATRVLAREAGLVWTLSPSGLEITAQNQTEAWRAQRTGLDFATDRLLALAASPVQIVLGTPLGTHTPATAQRLDLLRAPVDAAQPVGPFDRMVSANGTDILMNGRNEVWDVGGWRIPRVQERLWQDRLALDGDVRLRLGQGKSPAAWHRLDLTDGTQRLARFVWSTGDSMPFDRATALYAVGDDIWVGTQAGLRRMRRSGGAAMFDIAIPRPSSTEPAEPISRIGRPEIDPSMVKAAGRDGGCANLDTSLSLCNDPETLNRRFVYDDSLWHWTQGPAGLEGVYHFVSGDAPVSSRVSGRWPHDDLAVALRCQSAQFELWRDGVTLRDGDNLIQLPQPARNHLHCQRDPVPLGPGQTLGPGLFALDLLRDTEVSERGSPHNWSRLSDPVHAAAVRARARAEIPYEASRLRQRVGPVDTGLEYRTLDGLWRAMPWIAGRPALDDTRSILRAPGGLDRLTPLGILRQTDGSDRLSIDPDALVLRDGPRSGDLAACMPANFEESGGLIVDAARSDGLRLRCLDGRVFEETQQVGRRDIGALQLLEKDPFAERPAIDAAPWRWTILQPQPDRAPVSAVDYAGERIGLAAGRFAFDDYKSFAAPFRDDWHLVTTDGLRLYPEGGLSLHQANRPDFLSDPNGVTNATSDRTPVDGAARLCLSTAEGATAYAAEGTPISVERCADWRGSDGFWTLRDVTDIGPEATGIASNGPVMRRSLEQGRFSDLIATGMARADAQGIRVPNALGVLSLSPDGAPLDLVSAPGTSALVSARAGGYLALAKGGVRAIGSSDTNITACPALSDLATHLNGRVTLNAVERRGRERLRLFGRDANGRAVAFSARCDDPDSLGSFTETVQVATRTRFDALPPQSLPSDSIGLQVRAEPGASYLIDGAERWLPVGPGGDASVLTMLGRDTARSLFVLTEREAYLLDIDAALSELSAARLSLPRPGEGSGDNAPSRQIPPVEPDAPSAEPNAEVPEADTVSGAAQTDGAPLAPPARPSAPGPESQAAPELSDPQTLSPDVLRSLQTALKERGFYSLRVDGLYGPGTEFAIRAYQAARGEAQTGLLTPAQFADLRGDTR